MPNNLHIILEKDEDWVIGYCPEVPGANGQGKTEDECRQSVIDAVDLILQHRLEEALRGIPDDAKLDELLPK